MHSEPWMCPDCGAIASKTIQTAIKDESVYRGRKCSVCGKTWWTHELTVENYKRLKKSHGLLIDLLEEVEGV